MNVLINSLMLFILKIMLYIFEDESYKDELARTLPSRSICDSSNMSANNYHITLKDTGQRIPYRLERTGHL